MIWGFPTDASLIVPVAVELLITGAGEAFVAFAGLATVLDMELGVGVVLGFLVLTGAVFSSVLLFLMGGFPWSIVVS